MELAVTVLKDLLRYAAQLPAVFRDISMNHLPGLLTSLLGLRPEVSRLPAPLPWAPPVLAVIHTHWIGERDGKWLGNGIEEVRRGRG